VYVHDPLHLTLDRVGRRYDQREHARDAEREERGDAERALAAARRRPA
jgi:hypothetical protein